MVAAFPKLAAAARRWFGSESADPPVAPAQSHAPEQGKSLIGVDTEDSATEPQPPFTGRLERLDRLGMVRPGTVVLGFEAGSPPMLKTPGELLIPSWLPFLSGVDVLPVTTEPVDLLVRVKDLQTMDGHPINHVDLEVSVALVEDNEHAVVLTLAQQFGPRLGSHLMREVSKGVESAVRGAVRMNSLHSLRHQSVVQILRDRWMPRAFAGDALTLTGFSVREVAWPGASVGNGAGRGSQLRTGGATGDRPAPAVAAPDQHGDDQTGEPAGKDPAGEGPAGEDQSPPPPQQPSKPQQPRLELSLDARLARIWRANCPAGLRGIASATAHEEVTVIAVSTAEPGAYETSRLTELFGDLLLDRRLCLVIAVADSYEEIVRTWFHRVSSAGAVVGVEVLGRDDVLRVHLDAPLPTAERARRGNPSADGSEGQALLQLLPFRTIEFVSDVPSSPRAGSDPGRPVPR